MWKNKHPPPKTDLILPTSLRQELKAPLGQLITEQPTASLLSLIIKEQPPLVILVGDYCVQDFLAAGGIPNLSIIDHKNLREPFEPVIIPNARKVTTNNPPASITVDAWRKIRKIIHQQLLMRESVSDQPTKREGRNQQATVTKVRTKNPVVLFVEGEEDLLVLPAVLESPEETFVVYGQPHQGIVLIKVTDLIKEKFTRIINKMEPATSLNNQ
ncbi:MAG: DUF359 domain-containing protein [Candidatus Heimdallarchaeota archaeon]|nr:DUF359 domain-containing protein [Candidatus Heimdallarchaeota archaeon]